MRTAQSSVSLDQLKLIVDAGNLAPSGENIQPWRFVWDGCSLEIHARWEWTQSILNIRQSATWISLGAILQNITIAASHLGFQIEQELFLRIGENPIARLEFQKSQPTLEPLFSVLASRCTNRRPYHDKAVEPPVLEALRSSPGEASGISIDVVTEPDNKSRLATALASFDELFFENSNLHAGFHHWLRWTKREVREKQDGLSIQSLETNLFDRIIIRLTRSWTRARVLGRTPLVHFASRRACRIYRRSAAFALLTLDKAEPENFVQAGQAMQRLWLTAAHHGLSLQPVTGFVFFELRRRMDKESLSPTELRLLWNFRNSAAELLPNFLRKTPFMLFRLGYADSPSDRANRRPLKSILVVKETAEPHFTGSQNRLSEGELS